MTELWAGKVERASSAHAERVVELFERADVPCFCQYYQYAGDNREWQMRCAGERDENRAGLIRDLESPSFTAFLAVDGEQAVGWMRLDTPSALGKLYGGRLYRGLPCFEGDRERVFSIACFLVEPDKRRSGVASALLQTGLAWAKEEGGEVVEAFPRGAQDVTDEEQWMGPLGLFQSQGFETVHEFGPYPVLRRRL